MGKTYIGVSGVARQVKNIYVGVNGVARKVAMAYIGVGGVAKLIYTKYQTSETVPKYTASNSKITSDSQYNTGTRANWRAFSQDDDNYWASSETAMPHWIQYDFGHLVLPTKFTLKQNKTANFPTKGYEFLGSTNNSTWVTLASGNLANSSNTTLTVNLPSIKAYRYYRLKITSNYANGAGTTNNAARVKYLQIYGYKE